MCRFWIKGYGTGRADPHTVPRHPRSRYRRKDAVYHQVRHASGCQKDTPPQTAKTAAKKKLGFPVPIRVWLKEDKYYSIVRERFESDEANRFFHTEKLVHLLDDHRAGKADNSRKIWTLYMFLVWYQIYFPEACGA